MKDSETQTVENKIQNKEVIKAWIELNKRNGCQDNIFITVGAFNLEFTEENLEDIFDLINKFTTSSPYPDMPNKFNIFWTLPDNRIIHRPNHNVTHAARQSRYMELIFDLIETKGSDKSKEILKNLSKEEKINIKLAAFLLRSGRVDESSHKDDNPDDYYTRSAMIYDYYATILNVDPQTKKWISNLIIDSCKPRDLCKEAFTNDKSSLVYQMLSIVHEIDLVRCFGKDYMKEYTKRDGYTHEHLKELLIDDESAFLEIKNLYNFAISACQATGSHISYLRKSYDPNTYYKYSTEGKECWRLIKGINLQNLQNFYPSGFNGII